MSENEEPEEQPEEEPIEEPTQPIMVSTPRVGAPKNKGGRPKKKMGAKATVSRVSNPGPIQRAPVQEDDVTANDRATLMNIADVIGASRQKQMNTATAQSMMADLASITSGLSDEAMRHLANTEEFHATFQRLSKTAGRSPGTPVFDEKGRELYREPWTYEAMCKTYEMFRWMPPRDDIIEVNGVAVQVWEGREAVGPKVFYDIQMQSIEAERQLGRSHHDVLANGPLRYADDVSVGIGWHKMTTEELLAQPGNREV